MFDVMNSYSSKVSTFTHIPTSHIPAVYEPKSDVRAHTALLYLTALAGMNAIVEARGLVPTHSAVDVEQGAGCVCGDGGLEETGGAHLTGAGVPVWRWRLGLLLHCTRAKRGQI